MSVFFIDFRLVRRFLPLAVLAAIVAIGLAVFVYGTGSDASNQFEDSATNEGTWNWRVEAWQNYISDDTQTLSSRILGQPMGSGYVRFDSASGGYDNLPPHNEYVTQYLRVGILGLSLFLAFLLLPLLRLYKLQSKNPYALFPSASVWFLIIIGIFVYGVPYSFDGPISALIGITNSALLSIKSQQLKEPDYAHPID